VKRAVRIRLGEIGARPTGSTPLPVLGRAAVGLFAVTIVCEPSSSWTVGDGTGELDQAIHTGRERSRDRGVGHRRWLLVAVGGVAFVTIGADVLAGITPDAATPKKARRRT
jgi:hypothetical protein